MINWQLSKQGIRWPLSTDCTAGLSVDPSRSSIFEVICWQITSFKWSGAQVYFFQWFISNMLCLCHYGPALLGLWFLTDLGRENSASFFKNTGGEDLFLPWSRVGHALGPIFMLWLVKIWQVSSCRKFMQHLENTAAIKSLLFIHGLFAYSFFGWEMRRLSNSVIWFWMASFFAFHLA